MVPHTRPSGSRRTSLCFLLTLAAAVALGSACDKVPLLAPAGTVITIFPANTTVPLNGEIEIVVTVIENGTVSTPPTTGTGTGSTATRGAGTPVQNGTLVSFTTTLGRIEPREARTNNGEVRVRFIADGGSGTARITAYSGGAVGTIDNLLVGSAAADHLIVSISPQTVPSTGGTATVAARVENTAGTGISGVPVTFSTTNGTLSPTTATTDSNGVATTSITTSREATVTATAGTKSGTGTVRIGERSNLTITPPDAATVGTQAAFTITASTTAPITDAVINWGDGSSEQLGLVSGPVTRRHTYSAAGNYPVSVSGRNATGEPETASATVSVGGLQATMTATPNPAPLNFPVSFTVGNVSSAQVREYRWDFGDGATQTTPGPETQHAYNRVTTYTARVQVIGVNGSVLATPVRTIVIQ
ncbi:MAG: PKD domain-containing protein [Vicinamibacterales bacterium]